MECRLTLFIKLILSLHPLQFKLYPKKKTLLKLILYEYSLNSWKQILWQEFWDYRLQMMYWRCFIPQLRRWFFTFVKRFDNKKNWFKRLGMVHKTHEVFGYMIYLSIWHLFRSWLICIAWSRRYRTTFAIKREIFSSVNRIWHRVFGTQKWIYLSDITSRFLTWWTKGDMHF